MPPPTPPPPPPSSARTGASSPEWVVAKGGEEEVAVPRRVQWNADEGACPDLAPIGFDSNLLLPRPIMLWSDERGKQQDSKQQLQYILSVSSLKKSEAASTAPSMTD